MKEVTVRNLIDKSMKTIGVLGAGETADADEAMDALDLLNEIIGKFNNEDMFFPGSRRIEIQFNGNDKYELPYIDVDDVKEVYFLTHNNYVPLINISESEFIINQNKRIAGGPTSFYVDYSYPYSYLHILPFQASGKAIITTNERIERFNTIDDIVSMPDGWEICLRYSLAIRLCSLYGKSASDEIVAEAVSSKAYIKTSQQKKLQNRFYSDYPCSYRRN